MSKSDAAKESGLPPPSFSLLCASLGAQAQVALGKHENPITRKTEVDLSAARHAVALLEMLETKTKGNLEPDESRLLSGILYGLRMAFVEASKAR